MLEDNINLKRKFFTTFACKEIQDLKARASFLYRDASVFVKGFKVLESEEINNKFKKYNNEKNLGKILIVIPKKVGHAPKRNYMRRIIKELFFKNQIYNIKYNLIYIVNQSTTFLNIETIFQQLKNKLLKINNTI